MTEPEETLSYQSPQRGGEGLRTGVWVLTLIIGIFCLLAGGCLGTFLIAGLTSSGTLRRNADVAGLLLTFVFVMFNLVTGVLYINNSFKIARRIRSAAAMAQSVALANIFMLFIYMMITGVLSLDSGAAVFFVCGIWLIPIIAHVFILELCGRLRSRPSALDP